MRWHQCVLNRSREIPLLSLSQDLPIVAVDLPMFAASNSNGLLLVIRSIAVA